MSNRPSRKKAPTGRVAAQKLRVPSTPILGAPVPGAPETEAPIPLISACLIVKNEESTLHDCFASLHQLVDEVVVYDTGSTDGTLELARRAGARVFEGYWDDDFARARNAALEHCRGEWILWIDADERFACPDIRAFRQGLTELVSECDAVAIEIHNVGDDPISDVTNTHRALRMFRNRRCQWYGSIHEQVDMRPGIQGLLQVQPVKDAYLRHIGYRSDFMESRNKLERNLHLAEAALTKPNLMRGQEGVPELNMGRALAALNRNEEAQEWFEKAIELAPGGITKRASVLFSAQNLASLGRHVEALAVARELEGLCEDKGIARYFEGVSLRRLGRTDEAIAMLSGVERISNEDGFLFPITSLRAELGGAYLDAGRMAEAADQLALLVEQAPEVTNIRTTLAVFASSGKSLDDLVMNMPEDRLERLAAALITVQPAIADQVGEILFRRFGPRPQILAAAIKFGPLLATNRALEWAARLRSIGMSGSCPLIGQATVEVLEVPARIRAALTAYAAFSDERGAGLALALAPGVRDADIEGVMVDVSLLTPSLLPQLATALEGAADLTAGPSSPESRAQAVRKALARLADLAQSTNPGQASGAPMAQLAGVSADR